MTQDAELYIPQRLPLTRLLKGGGGGGSGYPTPEQASDGPYLLDAAFPMSRLYDDDLDISVLRNYYSKVRVPAWPNREVTNITWKFRTVDVEGIVEYNLTMGLWTNDNTLICKPGPISLTSDDTNMEVVSPLESGASSLIYPGLYIFGFKVKTDSLPVTTQTFLYGRAVSTSASADDINQGYCSTTAGAPDALADPPASFGELLSQEYPMHPLVTITFGTD